MLHIWRYALLDVHARKEVMQQTEVLNAETFIKKLCT